MTLASSPTDPNRADGERSAENLWSTVRHHTSSWSLLWRLLVLVLGVSTLLAAATTLMWLLGMRVGIAGFEVAPAS